MSFCIAVRIKPHLTVCVFCLRTLCWVTQTEIYFSKQSRPRSERNVRLVLQLLINLRAQFVHSLKSRQDLREVCRWIWSHKFQQRHSHVWCWLVDVFKGNHVHTTVRKEKQASAHFWTTISSYSEVIKPNIWPDQSQFSNSDSKSEECIMITCPTGNKLANQKTTCLQLHLSKMDGSNNWTSKVNFNLHCCELNASKEANKLFPSIPQLPWFLSSVFIL